MIRLVVLLALLAWPSLVTAQTYPGSSFGSASTSGCIDPTGIVSCAAVVPQAADTITIGTNTLPFAGMYADVFYAIGSGAGAVQFADAANANYVQIIGPTSAGGSNYTQTLIAATGNVAVTFGALTTNHLAKFDSSGRIVDGGAAGGCDPSALGDGAVLFVASGGCTGDPNHLRYDASAPGALLIGASAAVGSGFGIFSSDYLEVSSDTTTTGLSLLGGGANSPLLTLTTTRGTIATPSSLQSGDYLGAVNFQGYLGGSSVGAEIYALVSGVPGTHLPTQLSFTTASAAAATAEGLRLDSASRTTFGAGGFTVAPVSIEPVDQFGDSTIAIGNWSAFVAPYIRISASASLGAYMKLLSSGSNSARIDLVDASTSNNIMTADQVVVTTNAGGATTFTANRGSGGTVGGDVNASGDATTVADAAAGRTGWLRAQSTSGTARVESLATSGISQVIAHSNTTADPMFRLMQAGGSAGDYSNVSTNSAVLQLNHTTAQVDLINYLGILTFGNVTANTVWSMNGKNLISAGVAFASLGTPANGSFVYCTDCDAVTLLTCTSAGTKTGSFALRLNGAWKCVGA